MEIETPPKLDYSADHKWVIARASRLFGPRPLKGSNWIIFPEVRPGT
jgi:hypothetical protein